MRRKLRGNVLCLIGLLLIIAGVTGLLSGPEAITVTPSGISVTSFRITVTIGCRSRASVISREKALLSTARAPPAATLLWSAARITSDPIRRISAFSRPTALESSSLRRELEQTSSAKRGVWCAGVNRSGRIS